MLQVLCRSSLLRQSCSFPQPSRSSFQTLMQCRDMALTNPGSFTYNLIDSILIIVFTYFYTAIIVNPVQMADDMKRNGGFIPGVKPGKQTANFIDNVMSRITFTGCFLSRIHSADAFIRKSIRRELAVRKFLRWNFTAHYGGRNPGYASANRKSFVDAPLRWLNEIRSH